MVRASVVIGHMVGELACRCRVAATLVVALFIFNGLPGTWLMVNGTWG